jgi:hypothetical protein
MDSAALGTLRDKLLKEAKELEDALKERRDKIKAIDLVRGMLIEEPSGQTGDKSAKANNRRFRKMGLSEATLACMNEPIRWWSVKEIKKVLMDGGLKTRSKDVYSAISSTLHRLSDRGQVEVDKTPKGRRFRIKAEVPENGEGEKSA